VPVGIWYKIMQPRQLISETFAVAAAIDIVVSAMFALEEEQAGQWYLGWLKLQQVFLRLCERRYGIDYA
jgi:hypothetical protein